jgi:hypothetical protein
VSVSIVQEVGLKRRRAGSGSGRKNESDGASGKLVVDAAAAEMTNSPPLSLTCAANSAVISFTTGSQNRGAIITGAAASPQVASNDTNTTVSCSPLRRGKSDTSRKSARTES